MFNLHDFVMATLRGMVGREPEYKVRQYALGWYDKAELTEEDMAELEALLAPEGEPLTEEATADGDV